jgi:hypothetical protein
MTFVVRDSVKDRIFTVHNRSLRRSPEAGRGQKTIGWTKFALDRPRRGLMVLYFITGPLGGVSTHLMGYGEEKGWSRAIANFTSTQ